MKAEIYLTCYFAIALITHFTGFEAAQGATRVLNWVNCMNLT